MLEVCQLAKSVDGLSILHNLSFTAQPGTITGIVGRNGAGKTTLLRTIAGIFTPDAGAVRYCGRSVHADAKTRGHIVLVADTRELLQNEAPREIARLFQLLYPRFDRAAFAGWLHRYGLPSERKVRHFSKGMKALFYLALAFATRAEVVLLDEPTEGLDPIHKQQALRMIVEEVAEHRPTILISSHRLEELELIADRVYFLKDGAMESFADISAMPERYVKLQAAFADDVDVERLVTSLGALVLARSGRVYTLLAENAPPDLVGRLQSGGAIFTEQVPLRLEDLFIGKMGGGANVG